MFVTTRERPNGFLRNSILGSFPKICHYILIIFKIGQQLTQRAYYTRFREQVTEWVSQILRSPWLLRFVLISMATWRMPRHPRKRWRHRRHLEGQRSNSGERARGASYSYIFLRVSCLLISYRHLRWCIQTGRQKYEFRKTELWDVIKLSGRRIRHRTLQVILAVLIYTYPWLTQGECPMHRIFFVMQSLTTCRSLLWCVCHSLPAHSGFPGRRRENRRDNNWLFKGSRSSSSWPAAYKNHGFWGGFEGSRMGKAISTRSHTES
jgi:hypothetical protein